MPAFALDLRQRILDAARADGAPVEQAVAKRFGVSKGFVLAAERGVRVHRMTVNRVLLAAGLTLKKRRSEPPSATVTT